MSVDLKDLEAVPTLTLDPLAEMEEKEVPVVKEEPKPMFDETILSDDERKMVDSFAKQQPDSSVRSRCSEKNGRLFRGRFGKCKDQRFGRSGRYALQCGDGAEKL